MRRRLPPDKRLDWRDPNMLVIRMAKLANQPDAPFTIQELNPKDVHEYHKWAVQHPNGNPHWSDDPSYFWSKKNGKR